MSITTSTNYIKDIYVEEEKNEPTKAKKTIAKINYHSYVDEYNNRCTNLPKVKLLTDKRKDNIRNFEKTLTLEQFKEICDIANRSRFLIGDNDRGWKADFDFILRVDKATSILEGKYDKLGKRTEGNALLDMINGGAFDD